MNPGKEANKVTGFARELEIFKVVGRKKRD